MDKNRKRATQVRDQEEEAHEGTSTKGEESQPKEE